MIIPDSIRSILPENSIKWLEQEENRINKISSNISTKFLLEKGKGEWENIQKKSKNKSLLSLLQNKNNIKWIIQLNNNKFSLPQVPKTLETYLYNILHHSYQEADSQLYNLELLNIPTSFKQIFSGDSSKVLGFKDINVSNFFISLFEFIQASSPVDVYFTIWDLYHGHMFIHVGESVEDSNDNKYSNVIGDIGILFHAKEFPTDYRHSSSSPVYPIGDINMNGGFDPRIGSKYSTKDKDFGLRNYLWLLSTNSIYLFDTYHNDFPNDKFIRNDVKEFKTISEYCFSSNIIGNLNYFIPSYDNSDINMPYNIEYNDNTFIKWYKQQRYYYRINERNINRKYLYPSPIYIFTPYMKIKIALDEFLNIFKQIDKEDLENIVKIEENKELISLYPNIPNSHIDLIPLYCKEFINTSIYNRINIINKDMKEHNIKEENKLLELGYPKDKIKESLILTSSKQGQYSSFRAEHLLKACLSQYRSKEFYNIHKDNNYNLKHVYQYQKTLLYEDNTLKAIIIEKENPKLSIKEIISKITEKHEHSFSFL